VQAQPTTEFSLLQSSDSSDDALIETAVHEILHAIYFSPSLMEKFIDADGNELGNSGVFTTDYSGRSAVKTAAVLSQASSVYGCGSVSGVPLEDGGGGGSAGSHWEREHVGRDLMLAASGEPDHFHFSPFTLALAEDSGWYEANWDAAVSALSCPRCSPRGRRGAGEQERGTSCFISSGKAAGIATVISCPKELPPAPLHLLPKLPTGVRC